jgi:nucleoside-diphosphate-sugar epimerase
MHLDDARDPTKLTATAAPMGRQVPITGGVGTARRAARRRDPAEPLHKQRAGDVWHCVAHTLEREVLGYQPQVTFEAGLAKLAEWLRGRVAVNRVDAAAEELSSRGLL